MSEQIPRKIALSMRAQLEEHMEHPDPVPVEVPGGARGPRSLAELVADQVQRLLAGRQALRPAQDQVEDFEDWPDSLDPLDNLSVHQLAEMEHELLAADQAARQQASPPHPETGGEEPPGGPAPDLVESGAGPEH